MAVISGSSGKYTVKKGDTLWSIVANNITSVAGKIPAAVKNVAQKNNLKDPNRIVVGQVLDLSGNQVPTTQNFTNMAVIDVYGLQSDTDRTVYATWKWDQPNTDHYKVRWWYGTKDGMGFIGEDSTTEFQQSVYTAPSNADRVSFYVQPVAKTRKVNDVDTPYWTAPWSTKVTYYFSDNPPSVPPAPSCSIDKYLLTATIDNLDIESLNADVIHFQVVKDYYTVFKTSNTWLNKGFDYARYTCYVDAGSEYKVRCRTSKGDKYSDWSDYSSTVRAIPSTPSGITELRATSKTSIYLAWAETNAATKYDIEYTTKREYFDGSDETTIISSIESTHYEKTGLETGEEYFFRVRAVNDSGESPWSEIRSIVIGKTPSAPTTWSSTTTVVTGESLNLYWVHNAEDGSSQTFAELEIYVDGVKETHTIYNSTDEDEKDKTSVYSVDTTQYLEGTKIEWRVRTAGITNVLGDWSIQRSVDIYAPATLVLSMTDSNDELIETLKSFPFKISALAGPNTQIAIGYHLVITANEIYETTDNVGKFKMVNKGEEIYSKHFDISDPLSVILSSGDLSLENNVSYKVTCTVSMNSGLTASASLDFTVEWDPIEYIPNCEIGIDTETYTASIRPYCKDSLGNMVENVTLSVYRREFDGSFTELATGIDNMSNTFITDPHPALDFARYRIVSVSKDTGAVGYYDPPGYPVGGKAVLIQWDEAWSSFDGDNADGVDQPVWSGSMLKLPYNIDVTDSHKPDVEMVEYIGRSHPVSYYGTQLGSTSTWSVEIDKSDKNTIYALRRLANWRGNVYVREPSGSGYWANVLVTFSQKHTKVIVPVTLDITRVEGGA